MEEGGNINPLVDFTDMVWMLCLPGTQVFLFRWRLHDLLQNYKFYMEKQISLSSQKLRIS